MSEMWSAAIRAAFLSIICLEGAQNASAQAEVPATRRAGAIMVEAAWSREAPGGVKRAVGYMRITNTGQLPDRLVGGTATGTGRLEVHRTVTSNGFSSMRAVKDGLVIEPGETVEMKPGAMHVMLVDLERGPRAGEIIKGTLMFEKAGRLEIEYRVGGIGSRDAPTATAIHHHH